MLIIVFKNWKNVLEIPGLGENWSLVLKKGSGHIIVDKPSKQSIKSYKKRENLEHPYFFRKIKMKKMWNIQGISKDIGQTLKGSRTFYN